MSYFRTHLASSARTIASARGGSVRRACIPVTMLGVLAGLWLPGCEDLRCCNSCGRSYSVGDPLAYPGVAITGIEEGGNECEIDEIPRSIPDGLHTLIARIADVRPVGDAGAAVHVEVVEHFEGDVASTQCAGQPVLDAAALIEQEQLAVGDMVCLVDEVSAEGICTQKACALGS